MRCSLKNRLAECRAAKGIKKSQLAYYIGKSRGYVTRLERGDIRPSAEAMLRIAQYFGKPVEDVFQLVKEDDFQDVRKGRKPSSVGSQLFASGLANSMCNSPAAPPARPKGMETVMDKSLVSPTAKVVASPVAQSCQRK